MCRLYFAVLKFLLIQVYLSTAHEAITWCKPLVVQPKPKNPSRDIRACLNRRLVNKLTLRTRQVQAPIYGKFHPRIDHFTVVCSVTWSLHGSEAAGELGRFPFDQIFRFEIPGIPCDEWNSNFPVRSINQSQAIGFQVSRENTRSNGGLFHL